MIRHIAPQFFTTDMRTTLAFYEAALGFRCVGTWLDPPVYAIVERDGCRLHFRAAEVPRATSKYDDELLDAYLSVDDVDALHAELAAKGVVLTRPLGDTPWGAREFVVEDIDGRLLAFGGSPR